MSKQDFVGSIPAVIAFILAILAAMESLKSDRSIAWVFAYCILGALAISFTIWQARLTGEERGKLESERKELRQDVKDIKASLIYQSQPTSIPPHVPTPATVQKWSEVELKNFPAVMADYVLLLFKSDKGRIIGKVRLKGSTEEYPFSTTANSRTPIAVRNIWLPQEQHYKSPAYLEFLMTEITEPNARLSIYTQGWIDSRGQEPH